MAYNDEGPDPKDVFTMCWSTWWCVIYKCLMLNEESQMAYQLLVRKSLDVLARPVLWLCGQLWVAMAWQSPGKAPGLRWVGGDGSVKRTSLVGEVHKMRREKPLCQWKFWLLE